MLSPVFLSRLLLSTAALLLASSASADHIKVFLLGGQSNMVGTGASTSGLPVVLQSPQADVLFYYSSSLTTLRPGSGQNFGPEVTFGRSIADAFPSDNFGLIKYAAGGTAIHESWDPDPALGTVYNSFRAKVAAGLAAITSAGHTYEIVGMLWTQGERDSRIGRTTAQYEFDLTELIADIRTRYGTNLPFFLNRLSVSQTNLPNITPVRTAQENVAAADPFTYLIDADGMSFHDELHFDASGQIDLGEAFGQAYINSLVPDTTDPILSTLSPTNGLGDVPVAGNLEITFNEAVAFGTGFITLRENAGGAVVESFDVAIPSSNLTLGGSTLTINPSSDLGYSATYYVEIDGTAIDDIAGNSFSGFSGNSIWSFITEDPDTTDPSINSLSPVDGLNNVSVETSLLITFSETIAFGTGSLRLRDGGGTLIESFDVASPPAGLSSDGSSVTIDPTANLEYDTAYYVEIDATAIDDLAGNSFAGFSGNGTWSFTTAAGSASDAVTFVDGTASPAVGISGTSGTGVNGTATGVFGTTGAYSGDVSGTDLLNGLTPTYNGTWRAGRTPEKLVDGAHGGNSDTNSLIQWQASAGAATIVFDLGTGDNGFGYDLDSIVSIAAWTDASFGNQVWTLEVAGVGADGSLTSTDFSELLSVDYRPFGGGGASKVTVTGLSGALTSGVQYVRLTPGVNPAGNNSPGEFTWREFDIFGTSVVSGGNDYAAWIGGFGLDPADQDFSDDPDGDGLGNGLEAFFGTNPGTSSTGAELISVGSTTLTIQHPNPDNALGGLTGSYQWSLDLQTWYASDGLDGNGSTTLTAVATADSPTDNTTTVVATLSGAIPSAVFLRVLVNEL